MQPALFAEPLPKRLLPGTVHEDTYAVTKGEHVTVFDDMGMSALLQDFTLVFEPLVMFGIVGNLEHILLTVALDQEGHRTGTLAEASHNSKIAWKEITFLRPRWILNKFVLGCGQCGFDFVQITEKVRGGVNTIGDFRVCAILDQKLQFFVRAIEHRTDLQPSGFTQLIAKLETVGGRGLAREEVIGDRS